MSKEFYISIDIEADGPCPGLNSMRQLGAAFYDGEGNLLETFSGNLKQLPDAAPNDETMKWWREQEKLHTGLIASVFDNAQDPAEVINDFCSFITYYKRTLKAAPVCIAYPAGFDFTFLYYYLHKFQSTSIVGFSCIDIKSYASAVLNKPYRNTAKRTMPKIWFDTKYKHTHNGVDDALEQGSLFFKMREYNNDTRTN